MEKVFKVKVENKVAGFDFIKEAQNGYKIPMKTERKVKMNGILIDNSTLPSIVP